MYWEEQEDMGEGVGDRYHQDTLYMYICVEISKNKYK